MKFVFKLAIVCILITVTADFFGFEQGTLSRILFMIGASFAYNILLDWAYARVHRVEFDPEYKKVFLEEIEKRFGDKK